MKGFVCGIIATIVSMVAAVLIFVRKVTKKIRWVSEEASRGIDIIPLKDILTEYLKKFIDILIWGEVREEKKSYYHPFLSTPRSVVSDWKTPFIFIDKGIRSRGDGERILYKLRQQLDNWGYVLVNDLYKLVDGTAPECYKGYGWKDLSDAKVKLYSWEYGLYLPNPECLIKVDEDDISDDKQYFIEEKEVGGDGIYKIEYYNYFVETKKLLWLTDICANKSVEVDCPLWLSEMLDGYVAGYSYSSGEPFPIKGKRVFIRDQEEDKDYVINIVPADNE